MAATVTVLCPNGRRCNVKVTPSTVLLQILEQACTRQNFDPNSHMLKFHSKVLDLSTSFRYANLPNNAKLEMVATKVPRTQAAEVVVAIQHKDGSRIQGPFSPTTPLWEVVTQLGGRPVGGEGTEPVVVYTNQQIQGENSLRQQTLKDIGLSSGRGVIRLLFRPASEDCTPVESTSPKVQSSSDHLPQPTSTDLQTASTDLQTASTDLQTASTDLQSASTDLQTASKQLPVEKQRECTVAAESGISSPEEAVLKEEAEKMLTEDESSSRPSTSHKGEEQPPPGEPASVPTGPARGPVEEAMETSEMPYFPAHPFSIFPPDAEPTASITMETTSHQSALMEKVGAFFQQPLLFQQPFKFPEVTAQLLDDDQPRPKPQPPLRIYDEPCEREMVVYQLDDALSTPTEEVPESFFDHTVQDVHRIHEDLKRQVKRLAEPPLLTQAQRQAQQERKLDQYERAVIRVYLPDRWVLQGCFRPRESLKALVQFIRENLADPPLKFHLYTTPPKQVLRSGRITIAEAGFVPAAIVHLSTESEGRPLLSTQCLQNAQSALQAEVVHVRGRMRLGSAEAQVQSSSGATTEAASQTKMFKPGQAQVVDGQHTSQSQPHNTDHTRKVPKWFRKGK